MPDRYSFDYALTREDWLAANRALIATSPQYAVYAKQKQRATIKQMLWVGPLIIIGASLGIGRMVSTQGMYLEGALAGSLLVALMSFGLCRKSPYIEEARKRAEKAIQRMELGDAVGRVGVELDEAGVITRTASTETRTAWKSAVVHSAGDYFVLARGSASGMIIPKSAVGDEAVATEFAKQCAEWWRLGQQSLAERIGAYLAERDVACPTCKYNLRGVMSDKCPECGTELSIASLAQAKQS